MCSSGCSASGGWSAECRVGSDASRLAWNLNSGLWSGGCRLQCGRPRTSSFKLSLCQACALCLMLSTHSLKLLPVCSQFDLFLRNSFALVFLTFFLFQLAMSSLAFLLSTLLSKAASGTNLGFAIFIVGWIMQVISSPFSSFCFSRHRMACGGLVELKALRPHPA